MNPSYVRMNIPGKEAVARMCAWLGKEPKERLKTTLSKAVDNACVDGQWKGGAVYFYENKGWAVFEDLSGCLSVSDAQEWLRLAEQDTLVYAGYNDAILYGELIVLEGGQILRDFGDSVDEPEFNRNFGQLPGEEGDPIESWVGVASFVDEDDLVFCEKGELLIF